jgi:pyruvate,water dikinase
MEKPSPLEHQLPEGPWVLSLADSRDKQLVGGKAINLSRLIQAGFPVPDGFTVTTQAYLLGRKQADGGIPSEISRSILGAYRRMGSPPVAVRSSATAEDLADASMAGQYETILDVRDESALLTAVARCWKSLDTPRTRSYLAERGIAMDAVSMGVVVQQLIPADVAGVLFTANPRVGALHQMLVESSWGLGEAVVSGVVQPDTLILDRATGVVQEAVIADKEKWFPPGGTGVEQVPDPLRKKTSLNSQDVHGLWKLGLKVMQHFGSAQDIEWAIHKGKIYLLQSRAITTLEEIESYERTLAKTRLALREARQDGRGEWVRHNISETLPHPTPLTWSVVRQFMSGDGGFGRMYQEVGFKPSMVVCKEGFLDLVAGRIYMDLSRGAEIFSENYPLRYDVELLRADPNAAQAPPSVPKGGWRQLRELGDLSKQVNDRLTKLSQDLDKRLNEKLIPEFEKWVSQEKQRDLIALDNDAWLALWEERRARVMDDFGSQAMLPSMVAGMAMERLREFLAETFWDEEAAELANELSGAAEPDLTILGTEGLYQIATGQGSLEEWLSIHGHRAPEEFDLATPRWRERMEAVQSMASHLAGSMSPLVRHHERAAASKRRAAELETRLSAAQRQQFRHHLDLAHRYLPFRENGKFYLMLGYDLLRDMALDAGRRLQIGPEVFLLNFEELRDALRTGYAPLHLLEERRMLRAAEARIDLPRVIADADIERIPLPQSIPRTGQTRAFPISGGVSTGPVKIVLSPEKAGELGSGYILVCPSTDPNWTPLFVNAAGLVLERGGALSHGAVVAREIGIPAVVVDGATKIFTENQRLIVDGNLGTVTDADTQANVEGMAATKLDGTDPNDTRIPAMRRPPLPGPIERSNTKWRNRMLIVWGLFFAATFLLPAPWVHNRVMQALDALLLPIFAAVGGPVTVTVVAVALALFSMVGQRFLTDNSRLLAAKKRANALRKEGVLLPQDSPRARLIRQLTAPVQLRILSASLFPLILILGPMVMVFLWFPARIDPMSWNPAPGSTAFITAMVAGDHGAPIHLTHDAKLVLADQSPATQSIPLIRPVLEKLQANWRAPQELPAGTPWNLRAAAEATKTAMLDDLAAFLRNPMPARPITWSLELPDGHPGRYRVSLSTEGEEPVEIHLVAGNGVPPENKQDLGDGRGPVQFLDLGTSSSGIQSVRVTYREQLVKGGKIFWKPVEFLVRPWLPAWLIVYLLAYLPPMFLLRRILQLP